MDLSFTVVIQIVLGIFVVITAMAFLSGVDVVGHFKRSYKNPLKDKNLWILLGVIFFFFLMNYFRILLQ